MVKSYDREQCKSQEMKLTRKMELYRWKLQIMDINHVFYNLEGEMYGEFRNIGAHWSADFRN